MSGIARILKVFTLLLFVQFLHAQSASEEMLTLRDCINIALKNNSTLKLNRYNDQSAKMDVVSSYSGVLPSISVSAGRSEVETGPSEYLSNEPVGIDADGNVIYELRTRKTEKSTRKSITAGVSVDQTLFDGGIWWNQIRKAHVDKKAAGFNLASQRDNTILLVEQGYYDLLKQIKLLEVYDLAVKRSREQLDRAQKMYELGATAKLDVYRARVNLGTDRINYLNQKNLMAKSKRNMNLLLGRDPFTPLTIDIKIKLDKDLPDFETLLKTAFANQPLLKKNEMDLKSRGLSLAMAKGMNYPRLSAYVNYNRFHEDAARVFSNYDQNYQTQYGVQLRFNLFRGFSDYASVQKAEISRRSAQESFEEYKRNLKSTVHQYYDDYKSIIEQIEIFKDNIEAAQEEYRLSNERYQVGAGTALEVRESQVDLTRAEEQYIASQFNARVILAALNKELGLSYKKFTAVDK